MAKKRLQMQRRTTAQLEAARDQDAKRQPEPAGFDYNGLPRNVVNQYTCTTCGSAITTIDIHQGVTPAMLVCRATLGCEGSMDSHYYRVDQSLTPTHEWYMPDKRELMRLSPGMRQHVESGGLKIRPVNHG